MYGILMTKQKKKLKGYSKYEKYVKYKLILPSQEHIVPQKRKIEKIIY